MLDFNFYQLRLLDFLKTYHPLLAEDEEFIKVSANTASDAYSSYRKSGLNHIESQEEAMKVLFSGLDFSPYKFIIDILERVIMPVAFFSDEEREAVSLALLKRSDVKALFDEYEIDDSFSGSCEYDELQEKLTEFLKEDVVKCNYYGLQPKEHAYK